MESNYGSGESNYGYGGFSSESNYSSASALESRSSSYSSESRDILAPTYSTPSKPQNSKKYNSLDDIDKLIERLESSMQSVNLTSDRANQVLAKRNQKINELKKLVAEARKAEGEERMINQLEQDNDELDKAIKSIKRGFSK